MSWLEFIWDLRKFGEIRPLDADGSAFELKMGEAYFHLFFKNNTYSAVKYEKGMIEVLYSGEFLSHLKANLFRKSRL